jgi:hypothetical protein
MVHGRRPTPLLVARGIGRSGIVVCSLAATAALSAVMVLVGPARSAAPTGSQDTVLTVGFEASAVQGVPDYLVARLTLTDGSAIEGAEVAFLRTVGLGGERSVLLGVATTDRGGNARVAVVPREERYRLTVRFAGTDALSSSEVSTEVAFPQALVVHPDAAPRGGVVDPRLRPLADLMPVVIGGAIVLIWLVLFAVTGLTLRRISAERRPGGEAAAPVGAQAAEPRLESVFGREPVDRRMS